MREKSDKKRNLTKTQSSNQLSNSFTERSEEDYVEGKEEQSEALLCSSLVLYALMDSSHGAAIIQPKLYSTISNKVL